MEIWIQAANSVEPGQTAQMCMLAWLYACDKALHNFPLVC